MTSIDQDPKRAADPQAVALGGVGRLTARRENVNDLPFGPAPVVPVPESASWPIIVVGLLGIASRRRRRLR